MSSSPIAAVLDVLDAHPLTPDAPLTVVTDGDQRSLARALASVPDPRRLRGVRHRFTPLLASVVCAMLCGARSFAAIGEWIADLPGPARAALALSGPAPAQTTLWRLLVAVDPQALQAALGAWLRARVTQPTAPTAGRRPRRRVLAVDGKAMRATLRGTNPVHLLGVLDHATGVVLAQTNVDIKTNEIGCFTSVLDQIDDLDGVVVTADALHAQTGHITYLRARGAHLLVCVKANQCATRRSDTSPPKAGQTRREVCWARWLTWIRKVKGTRACQEIDGWVQMPETARRGARAVWRRLDCLNPNLQRQQFTATGTASEAGIRHGRGVLVRPGQPSGRKRCPARALKEMSGAPAAALNVCQRRTWDHRPSSAGGDGVPVVVAGVTPGQGERESRSQGEGAQVERTTRSSGGMRNAER